MACISGVLSWLQCIPDTTLPYGDEIPITGQSKTIVVGDAYFRRSDIYPKLWIPAIGGMTDSGLTLRLETPVHITVERIIKADHQIYVLARVDQHEGLFNVGMYYVSIHPLILNRSYDYELDAHRDVCHDDYVM
jgi:hypothetical protein